MDAIVDELEFALECLGSCNVEEIENGIKVHAQFNKEYFGSKTDICKLRYIFDNYIIGLVLKDHFMYRNLIYKLTNIEDKGEVFVVGEKNKRKWCYESVFTFEKGI